jgi:tripartite-type tricarboxylate transporter receptor subunit TctC
MFGSLPASIEYIRAFKLRGLAVTTAMRSDLIPEVPTVSEFVPGYEASGWYGVCAPKSTPVEVIDKLNKEINAALVDPKLMKRLAEIGGNALPGSPADFGKLICGRDREVGQGHPGGQHQVGVTSWTFHKSRKRLRRFRLRSAT